MSDVKLTAEQLENDVLAELRDGGTITHEELQGYIYKAWQALNKAEAELARLRKVEQAAIEWREAIEAMQHLPPCGPCGASDTATRKQKRHDTITRAKKALAALKAAVDTKGTR